MPIPFLVNTAKETGKDIKDLEKSWKEAQKIVKKQYKRLSSTDPSYFALTTEIFKNLEHLNESLTEITPDFILSRVEDIHGVPEDFEEGDIADRIFSYDHYDPISDIPMNLLNHEEWSVDEDYVDELIDQIKANGGKYEPVVVGEDPPYTKYTILDGTHRINALFKMGYKTVRGYIGRLAKDELTEDGEGVPMNTTASAFTDAEGNDTRYKTPVLNTVSRGGGLPKPKVKKPAGYSRMMPSMKSIAEAFKRFGN